uniref:ribosomal protein S19 family protein n=1 Tax=Acinetobacter baumannii TaxID=470 RepID=UPI000810CFE6
MTRSPNKGPLIDAHLFGLVEAAVASNSRSRIKTWSRRPMMPPHFIDLTISVHTGRNTVPVIVTELMV